MTIKVWALSTCPYCRMTRKWLDEQGVDYEAVEVDKLEGQERTDAIDEVKQLTGGSSFPVVKVDDEIIVGFNKQRLQEMLGK